MSTYKIIHDEKALKEFIEWLPQLQKDEVYYCSLIARSKYCKEISHIRSDKSQLHRFTATKDYLFNKIQRLECALNSYTHKGKVVPQEALAVYINVNPRNLVTAAESSLIRLANLISKPYTGYNPQAEVMSIIQKSRSRRIYLDLDFDLDTQEEIDDNIQKIKEAIDLDSLDENPLTILRTRGGFHALLNLGLMPKKNQTWYKNVTALKGIDIKGDNLIPVPGCTQGNFTPYFL